MDKPTVEAVLQAVGLLMLLGLAGYMVFTGHDEAKTVVLAQLSLALGYLFRGKMAARDGS